MDHYLKDLFVAGLAGVAGADRIRYAVEAGEAVTALAVARARDLERVALAADVMSHFLATHASDVRVRWTWKKSGGYYSSGDSRWELEVLGGHEKVRENVKRLVDARFPIRLRGKEVVAPPPPAPGSAEVVEV
jgi:hypothetical protein